MQEILSTRIASAEDINGLHDERLLQYITPGTFAFVGPVYAPSSVASIRQRKEEQERARKAVEEKSAQVKREKEALSKKQELETAQAAEQAKREKMKAEEERQVQTCL